MQITHMEYACRSCNVGGVCFLLDQLPDSYMCFSVHTHALRTAYQQPPFLFTVSGIHLHSNIH